MPTELLTKDRPPRSQGVPGETVPPPGWSGDGSGGPWPRPASAADPGLFAVGATLASVTMLFIAFTTAYLARQQETSWPAIALPPVLWANTAVLLLAAGCWSGGGGRSGGGRRTTSSAPCGRR